MRAKQTSALFFFLFLCAVLPARAQFIGFTGGASLPRDLGGAAAERTEFSRRGYFAADVGMRMFPLVNMGLHFSLAGAGAQLRRSDAFGSRADLDLSAKTVTFDTRLRAPYISGFRVFGLAGAGVTRFGVDVKNTVETPFPGGAPGGITSFTFTYGGGIERHLHQLVHLRFEVRDYVSPVSDQIYRPGGLWHRVAVSGGITIGL